MKVLNLCCGQSHRFEGWFGSDADFATQCERQLVACPLCGDQTITRLPSAPHLNVSHLRHHDAPPPSTAVSRTPDRAQAQAQWLHAVRELMQNSEDVGPRFPEEVRRMHYGETEERPIRGQASFEEAVALHEEGIEVVALPVPEALKGPLQ